MCNGNCEQCSNHEPQEQPSRRTLLAVLVGLINTVLIGGLVGPVLGFVGSPLANKPKGQWRPLLEESELPVGATKEATFSMKVLDGYMTVDRKYTVFVRRYEDRVVCFDPACTHLGCRINHDESKGRYLCPCHGGVFDADGNVVSGPPPKPLEQHRVKIDGGQIWIYKEV